jgi:predicted small metal-binding protein
MDAGKTIECPCGVVLRGADDDDVVAAAQEHAKANHDMDLTREQALGMAHPG